MGLLRVVGALAVLVLVTWPLPAQTATRMRTPDRERLAEAFRLGELLRPRLWPGWERAPAPVLLVTDSVEYLVGHPRPTAEFRAMGDSIAGRAVLVRPRIYPPTLLATFPAVGGLPTAVVGTAERTGKSSAEWVLAVLHEQFHQWQYSRPWYYPGVEALGLAGGDTTGRWMLDFPFPYDSPHAGAAVERLVRALAAVDRAEAAAARTVLGKALTPEEERYLEFQLWQEGVARWVELAAARAAASAGRPDEGFRALHDYQAYTTVARFMEERQRADLAGLRLDRDRRVAFYSLGAAIAALLERSDRDWRARYEAAPFRLSDLLVPGGDAAQD